METQNLADKLAEMQLLGADWWNDSCDLNQLAEAVSNGATGATSNPVIVEAAVNSDKERWLPYVKELGRQFPKDNSEAITWRLISEMGRQAANILQPVFERTGGEKGYLSLQVNPKLHRDARAMVLQAEELTSLAPNIAIKLPATKTGLEAIEQLTEKGISVNVTVSFSVSQAIAAADAIERGLSTRKTKGEDSSVSRPHVTIMIGRVGDHLLRIADREGIDIPDNDLLTLAGVYVFKHAARLFIGRSYQSTLLAAAYRHELQWSQIIGKEAIQSIPYSWWIQFRNSEFDVRETLWEEVDANNLQWLKTNFEDFEKVYEENGLSVDEFESFEATQHTLTQFIEGYEKLVRLVGNTLKT